LEQGTKNLFLLKDNGREPAAAYLPLSRGVQPEAPERTSSGSFPGELAASGSRLSVGRNTGLLFSFTAFSAVFICCRLFYNIIICYARENFYSI